MKVQILSMCALLLSTVAHADISLKAADLEKICSSSSEDERIICTFIVKAFKDGFIEGVAYGAMGTYRHDPDIYLTFKDIKGRDFVPRYNAVVAQSTCIQNVQAEDMAEAFSAYVKQTPSMQASPYRTAMFRMIESTYCK